MCMKWVRLMSGVYRRAALRSALSQQRSRQARRPTRSRVSPVGGSAGVSIPERRGSLRVAAAGRPIRPILIAGGSGTLGSALARACELRGLRTIAIGRDQLDITSPEAILQALHRWSPWAIINAAGYVRVDDAESHRDACWRLNTTGALQLAAAAAAFRAHYVTVSTDLVFDGLETRPYLESDATKPLNVYGASKSAAEEWILALFPDTLIVRTAALFDPVNQHGFLTRALREVSAGREVVAAADIVTSPTYVPHLADAMLDLLIDRERGIWHLANRGTVSWAGFVTLAAGIAGLDESLVRGIGTAELGLTAQRPPFSPLDSERGKSCRHWNPA